MAPHLGDFVAASQVQQDSTTILPHLRELVNKFKPVPTTRHGRRKAVLPKDLQTSDYVFIRRDVHRTPLQRPYEGPFHVLERGPKFFKIDFAGGTDTVTVDHLKPAHLDLSQPVRVAQPRRRGRPPTNHGYCWVLEQLPKKTCTLPQQN